MKVTSPKNCHRKCRDKSPRRARHQRRREPFTCRITDHSIPKSLEKLLKLESYDRRDDLDKHLEHIDIVLDYHQEKSLAKCKLFILTLKCEVMMWFRGFKDNLIDSWRTFSEEFTSSLLHEARKPKTIIVLSAIVQGKKEIFRENIERFNREVVEVKVTTSWNVLSSRGDFKLTTCLTKT